jgi:hypothetical protein
VNHGGRFRVYRSAGKSVKKSRRVDADGDSRAPDSALFRNTYPISSGIGLA